MVLTAEDLQAISHMIAAAFANVQQPGGGAAVTTPSGRKVALHPKCFSRLDKFAGGEEKWREWSYDFRMATATQNATVFEILNWIEENGEHTFREIMATDPEGIQNGRFNGMGDDRQGDLPTPGAQHRERGRQRWSLRQWRTRTGS